MKKLKDLDQKLHHFDGSVSQAVRDALPTFWQMYVNCLGASQAENGEQAISMYQLGAKIKDTAFSEIDLEDAEFHLLREKCQRNALGWVAHYHAQVLLKLKETEK